MSQLTELTTMTLQQIKAEIDPLKVVSRPQLYNYLAALGIEALGARQRPQNYPQDTADRIKKHLGLVPVQAATRSENKWPKNYPPALVRALNTGTAWKKPKAKIPTMTQLRAERKKARGK